MNKEVVLTESQIDECLEYIMESNFYFKHKNVLKIKKFLDRMCHINFEPDIQNGYPVSKPVLYLMNPDNNEAFRPIEPFEVIEMLNDRFPKIVKDEADRKRYFKQVIKDWYHEVTNRLPHQEYLRSNFAVR